MPTTCRRRPKTKTALSNPKKYPPTLVTSDEDLLAEYAKTGNQEAFGGLVRRYERELYSYLRNILGDTQLAEDAFQATFLKLHLKCLLFEPGRRLRPWLYAIANNQAIDILRQNRRHKLVRLDSVMENASMGGERHPQPDISKSADSDPGRIAHAIEDRQRIGLAMQKIPEKLRQVIIMIVYQGLKYREAAAKLGIPHGTLKSRMHKALQSLHEAIITANQQTSQNTPKTMTS